MKHRYHHLGLARIQAGQTTDGRESLDRALALVLSESDAAEANRVRLEATKSISERLRPPD